ncbi:circadian associated repressor of transcription a [Lepisosteus oculatus]|uniref:circadian associated repressor of transcription a n=1 Tax=Lepisosteus oculatus TaxID=7918 RepID=UPI003720F226
MLQSRARRGSLASSDGCVGSEDDADEGRTEGDLLFAQKCAELQGFVRPLLELLNGLKRGRYDRGLSSFQQSVAMDRIQRIVGVLQNPAMGERYLPTLLQVEAMLKLWFPHIATPPRDPHPLPWPAAPTSARPPAPSGTRPGGERDQLRIPVKKRKLSWPDSESVNEPFTHNQSGRDEGTSGAVGATVSPGPQPPRSPQAGGGGVEGSGSLRAQVCPWSQAGLTWVHSAPICTPPQSCGGQAHEGGRGSSGSSPIAAVPPPASRGRPATQDSAVSSTTPPSCPRPPTRCSSEPVARETRRPGGGAPLGACQGRAQSLLALFNPSGAAEERTAEHT